MFIEKMFDYVIVIELRYTNYVYNKFTRDVCCVYNGTILILISLVQNLYMYIVYDSN